MESCDFYSPVMETQPSWFHLQTFTQVTLNTLIHVPNLNLSSCIVFSLFCSSLTKRVEEEWCHSQKIRLINYSLMKNTDSPRESIRFLIQHFIVSLTLLLKWLEHGTCLCLYFYSPFLDFTHVFCYRDQNVKFHNESLSQSFFVSMLYAVWCHVICYQNYITIACMVLLLCSLHYSQWFCCFVQFLIFLYFVLVFLLLSAWESCQFTFSTFWWLSFLKIVENYH